MNSISMGDVINILLNYLTKCIDNTMTPSEISLIKQLPYNTEEVNRDTELHLKYYTLGWYIYHQLEIQNKKSD